MNHGPRRAEPGEQTAIVSEGRIAAYLRGELLPHERAALEAAMDLDPAWLAVLAVLARDSAQRTDRDRGVASPGVDENGDSPSPRSAMHEPSPSDGGSVSEGAALRLDRELAARIVAGERVGRYHIERCIGEGGMGRVYAAFDPQLDRAVAIKVLRTSDPRAQARLVREARSLARLSSPHVVAILDVGTWRGRMFLAMELVDGPNLRQWAAAQAQPWQAIVEAYLAAGRGLVAAHAVGVVHRDFKPANAMRRSDGRVVVLDFGLAAAVAEHTSDTGMDDGSSDAAATTVGGTAAYMAPEQRRGEPCTPRSDQFSFCVALFEALHGRLPEVVPCEQPTGRVRATGTWPAALDRLLARGLELEPRQRHDTQLVLVEAIADLLHPRSRRWPFVATAGLALVGAATWWSWVGDRGPCGGSDAALAVGFSPDDAKAVAQSIAALDRPWSAQTSTQVESGLVAYGESWVAEHEAICRATHDAHTQSEPELEARMRCLDRRRSGLVALVSVLREADVAAAARAVLAVHELPAPAECRALAAPQGAAALPEGAEVRAEIEAIGADLGRIDALRRAQRWDAAQALAETTMTRATATGHAPTEADAVLAAAGIAQDRGEHAEAERLLRLAVLAGESGGHADAVATAWNRLTWIVGHELARHDEGRECARRAAEWTRRLPRTRKQEVSRLRALGWIEHDDGADDLALTRFGEALALAEQPGDDGVVSRDDVALVLNGTGAAALGAGRLDDAERAFARAADELTIELGPDHPDVARVRNNVAALRRALGEPDVAAQIFERNLVVFVSTFGETHSDVGSTRINLAVALLDLGRFAEAHTQADAAVRGLQAELGAGHPTVAKAMTIRGDASLQLDRVPEAIADFEAALVVEIETLGSDHPSVAILESNLGDAYYAQADLEKAEMHQRKAKAVLEASLGEEHPNVAFVLVGLGLTLRDRGRHDEALAAFRRAQAQADATLLPNATTRVGEMLLLRGENERALVELERARQLQQGIATSDALAGDTLAILARARWVTGDELGARTAAAESITAYEAVADRGNAAAVRTWLAAHGG